MKKILPYLILNIIVSALTTLAVILIWNAAHPTAPSKIITSGNPPSQSNTTKVNATLPALDRKTIEIQNVIVPGDLQNERVVIKNVSDFQIDLDGWVLQDQQNHSYMFPSMILYPGGAVSVWSRAGTNLALELYWGSDTSVWVNGEKVKLLDPQNNLRSEYLIP
jgi:hypothetical protein